MPRISSSGGVQCAARSEFAVTPWQRKRPAAPKTEDDTYQETFIAPGSAVEHGDQECQAPEPSSTSTKAFQRSLNDDSVEIGFTPDEFDSELDAPSRCGKLALCERVPSISGAATVALLGSPTKSLIGHIRGTSGEVTLSFVTHVLLHNQECTRDNDWSLHILRATLPRTSCTLQLLVEVTGEHAVRLRSPPAVHGQEELVGPALRRLTSHPCHEATLSFDCEQLQSEQAAHEVVKVEGLRVFEPVQAVATGRLQLFPSTQG